MENRATTVNRKTFYYHFHNIYDLVSWMFEEEAIEVVKQFDLISNYEDAIRFSMEYIEENEHVCNSALDAVSIVIAQSYLLQYNS